MSHPTRKLLIDGTPYKLKDEHGTGLAWRLTKPGAKPDYMVDRVGYLVQKIDATIVCSCPDYTNRHAGTKNHCKHGAAIHRAGLL